MDPNSLELFRPRSRGVIIFPMSEPPCQLPCNCLMIVHDSVRFRSSPEFIYYVVVLMRADAPAIYKEPDPPVLSSGSLARAVRNRRQLSKGLQARRPPATRPELSRDYLGSNGQSELAHRGFKFILSSTSYTRWSKPSSWLWA